MDEEYKGRLFRNGMYRSEVEKILVEKKIPLLDFIHLNNDVTIFMPFMKKLQAIEKGILEFNMEASPRYLKIASEEGWFKNSSRITCNGYTLTKSSLEVYLVGVINGDIAFIDGDVDCPNGIIASDAKLNYINPNAIKSYIPFEPEDKSSSSEDNPFYIRSSFDEVSIQYASDFYKKK